MGHEIANEIRKAAQRKGKEEGGAEGDCEKAHVLLVGGDVVADGEGRAVGKPHHSDAHGREAELRRAAVLAHSVVAADAFRARDHRSQDRAVGAGVEHVLAVFVGE